jgi:hypothetical protein
MAGVANSLKAGVIALLFGVVSAAFLAVPFWFLLGFFFMVFSGHVSWVQVYIAGPTGLAFGAWVATMTFDYFRNGMARDERRTRLV